MFNPLDFEHIAVAEKSPGSNPRNFTYWVTVTFIFDKVGADPSCTAKPLQVE